jgi:tetratricopeptide (TPR) repeat protein
MDRKTVGAARTKALNSLKAAIAESTKDQPDHKQVATYWKSALDEAETSEKNALVWQEESKDKSDSEEAEAVLKKAVALKNAVLACQMAFTVSLYEALQKIQSPLDHMKKEQAWLSALQDAKACVIAVERWSDTGDTNEKGIAKKVLDLAKKLESALEAYQEAKKATTHGVDNEKLTALWDTAVEKAKAFGDNPFYLEVVNGRNGSLTHMDSARALREKAVAAFNAAKGGPNAEAWEKAGKVANEYKIYVQDWANRLYWMGDGEMELHKAEAFSNMVTDFKKIWSAVQPSGGKYNLNKLYSARQKAKKYFEQAHKANEKDEAESRLLLKNINKFIDLEKAHIQSDLGTQKKNADHATKIAKEVASAATKTDKTLKRAVGEALDAIAVYFDHAYELDDKSAIEQARNWWKEVLEQCT